jgi:hypothetical protein
MSVRGEHPHLLIDDPSHMIDDTARVCIIASMCWFS